jgi:hypothetical protein
MPTRQNSPASYWPLGTSRIPEGRDQLRTLPQNKLHPVAVEIRNQTDFLICEIISSPIWLMSSSPLEDRKWVWKLDTKGVAKDAHHHAVYQDDRKRPIDNRH